MVITQQLVKEIDGFVRDKSLVLRCHKAVPRLLLEVAQDVIVLCVQFNLILVKVVEEVVGSEDLGNLDKLIRIAVAVEKGLFPEDHGSEHSSQTPHVEAVIILLEIN